MKPSDLEESTDRLYSLHDTTEQPRCKVVLWDERKNHPKKVRLDEYTKESCQGLIEGACKKFGKELGLEYGVDFKVIFSPELDGSFKYYGGATVTVIWGIMPRLKTFKKDLDVVLGNVKMLSKPKAIDLRSRINEISSWCKSFNKFPPLVDRRDVRIEEIRLVRITHKNGLISDHSAPATGIKSKSWRVLISEGKQEVARVIELLRREKED